MIVTAGKTNVSVYYYIVGDAGHATPGEPVTGLLYSDIETGGSASYARQGAARVDLTLITLASASAAHSDGGFILVDDTNMPGVYRCDYADAAFATGVDQVFLSIVIASGKNAVAAPIMVDISDVDLRSSSGVLGVNMTQISGDSTAADNLEVMTEDDSGLFLSMYNGPIGPGAYVDSSGSGAGTTVGTDATPINPVTTIAAAKTVADALGTPVIYFVGNSDETLAATMQDYVFYGIGEVTRNVVNLGSQDVDGSQFFNVTLEGTQGGIGRLYAECCALQDPGAGATTLNIFASKCGIVDDIEVDTSNDNVFDQCYSLVAGSGTPKITCTGAAGTISIRHYSGGIELGALSASHNVSVETDGQVVFTSDCNVNASVSLRGNMTVTDNTAGMNSITEGARFDMAVLGGATFSTTTDSLEALRNNTGTAGAGLTAINLPNQTMDIVGNITGNLSGSVGSVTGAVGSVTGAVGSVTGAVGSVAGNVGGNVTGSVGSVLGGINTTAGTVTTLDALFTTALTEAYAANGAAPTLAEATFAIHQMLMQFGISGTAYTVRKLDNTTTAFAVTLDDATTPTDAKRV